MKNYQLKKENRENLLNDSPLRLRVAADMNKSEPTLRRWANENDEMLTTKAFEESYRRHTGITDSLIEEFETTQTESVAQ